ncbi:MAG: hypothetical protein RLZZ520_456, partial [Bacteroidota bacterium]
KNLASHTLMGQWEIQDIMDVQYGCVKHYSQFKCIDSNR